VYLEKKKKTRHAKLKGAKGSERDVKALLISLWSVISSGKKKDKKKGEFNKPGPDAEQFWVRLEKKESR